MTQKQAPKNSIKSQLLILVALIAVAFVSFYIGASRANAHSKTPKTVATTTKPKSTPNICVGNTSGGKTVLVSITKQHMWSCQGTTTVEQSAVTTGSTDVPNNVDDATPTGTFQIYEKFRDLPLKGCDANGCWDDYVQYWMPFDTAVGFHDASWQTFPFGSNNYKTQGSHGCVQLPTATAAWLYNWAPIGTKVVVSA